METKQVSNQWFLLFSAGDSRSNHYGWSAFDKEEYSRAEVTKASKRLSKRKGEQMYCNYFIVGRPYITDSVEAFKKRCEKVGLNPNLSNL